jgi:Mrp family chromosome partitioning ATPase
MHGTALEELLVRTDISRCVVLLAGERPPRASEMLGSMRMRSLADELKRRYANRLVIIDMPPVLGSPAGAAMLPCLDAVLLVVEDGRTSGEDARRTAQLIGPERLLGTVLNKSREEG